MLYLIKKRVEAKSFNEAVKLEPKAEIVDIWTEVGKEPEILTPAIGFTVDEEEDDVYYENI